MNSRAILYSFLQQTERHILFGPKETPDMQQDYQAKPELLWKLKFISRKFTVQDQIQVTWQKQSSLE